MKQIYNKNLKKIFITSIIISLAFNVTASDDYNAPAQGVVNELHFSHPIVAESPSPDTKVRIDHQFLNLKGDEDNEHRTVVEGEYAFNRSISIEAAVSYSFLNRVDKSNENNFNNAEIAIKYANYTFEENDLLIGGGLELVLPTGDDSKEIGSNNIVVIEPFLDFGYYCHDWEFVGVVKFGIPTNKNGKLAADLELGWNFSALYHLNEKIKTLIELDGEHIYDGSTGGFEQINITPGIKFKPLHDHALQIGLAASLPLTNDKEFDARTFISVFYHY